MSMEFTSRYEALGIPFPDPATMCDGRCEGTGIIPIKDYDPDPVYRALALDRHLSQCIRRVDSYKDPCDGWHFVRCQQCNGTGRKP